MKRLHVHIVVRDLGDSIGFYKTLFDAEPSVLKDDYAKWMLDDPYVNFAISARGGAAGLNHLGVQVDAGELAALTDRLQSAGRAVSEQSDAACCYAKWMLDDPCVNFAISARGGTAGINHLGVQVEADELAALTGRLRSAGRAVAEQSDAACCYAKSDKTWIEDPEGVRWEAFHSTGEIAVFGADTVPDMKPARAEKDPCCGVEGTAG